MLTIIYLLTSKWHEIKEPELSVLCIADIILGSLTLSVIAYTLSHT